jgi:COMPASS component SWD2
MNPVNDTFLTTSRDKTSRLWDLNKRTCLCIFQDSNHATFDSTGDVIFSVACDVKNNEKSNNFINLYSMESYLKGPFKVFKVENVGEIKHLKISNNGLYLCCATNDNSIIVMNAYDGNIMKKLTGDISEGDLYFKIDISADSKYLVSGSDSGSILLWNIEDKNDRNDPIATLNSHPLQSNCVKFSPRHCILVSSCINYIIWHPSSEPSDK